MKGKRISDIQLAAWLVSEGYAIKGMEGDPHRRIFVFDVSDEKIMSYYQGKRIWITLSRLVRDSPDPIRLACVWL